MGIKTWSDSQRAGPMLQRIPLQRFAQPEDVADAILFLLSDEARMVNGVCLDVDGGFCAS
jgi:NAD(P)-dependent dehydrogenase (short-subunit alcohol dehydrogenase family)